MATKTFTIAEYEAAAADAIRRNSHFEAHLVYRQAADAMAAGPARDAYNKLAMAALVVANDRYHAGQLAASPRRERKAARRTARNATRFLVPSRKTSRPVRGPQADDKPVIGPDGCVNGDCRPLLPGEALRGPDYYGCYNTGTAPYLLHNRQTGRFYVGPELAVADAVRQVVIRGLPKSTAMVDTSSGRVWLYSEWSAAFAKWSSAVNSAVAENNRVAAERKAVAAKAAHGDIAAALALGDY